MGLLPSGGSRLAPQGLGFSGSSLPSTPLLLPPSHLSAAMPTGQHHLAGLLLPSRSGTFAAPVTTPPHPCHRHRHRHCRPAASLAALASPGRLTLTTATCHLQEPRGTAVMAGLDRGGITAFSGTGATAARARGVKQLPRGGADRRAVAFVVVAGCMPAAAASASAAAAGGGGGGGGGVDPAGVGPTFAGRRNRRNRRSPKADSPAPSSSPNSANASGGPFSTSALGGGSGPLPSAASSPVPAPSPGGGTGSGGGGSVATAAVAVATVVATVDTDVSPSGSASVAVATSSLDGSQSDYEGGSGGEVAVAGNHIVPFARRQPRALVLDCAYRPINVLTWYRAFHFDYFGKGEVLEYYPPPAVCTTGSGDHPLPAVLRVPQYTADMQDLCSRVSVSRRNVMVRDGFCCQYCGSRRDLTIDHVHPVSKGGKETWDNLVTACMKCNQKKSDRTLRELGWKLRRQPKEPSPYEIGIVAGISTGDILRPPPEWEAYIAPYKERLETYRKAAVEAGLANLIDDA